MARHISFKIKGAEYDVLIAKDKEATLKAADKALYKTTKRMKTIASQTIRKYLNLPKATVDSYLTPIAADGVYKLRVRNKADFLSMYPNRAAAGRGKFGTGRKRSAGIRVRIWKGRNPVQLRHAFHVKTPGDEHVATRKGKERYPLTFHRGPAVGSLLLWARREVFEPTQDAFVKEFNRELERKGRGF